MRDFAKIKPRFWSHGDGKALRGDDAARVLVTYLFSSPSSNMVGLYYLPLPMILAELGWDEQKLRDNLAKPAVRALARYDWEQEIVYLPTGAKHQVGATLKPGDLMRKAVIREVLQYADHPFAKHWMGIYEEPYNLRTGTRKNHEDLVEGTKLEQWSKVLPTASEGVQGTPSEGVEKGSLVPVANGSSPAPSLSPAQEEGGSGGGTVGASEIPDARAAAIAAELARHDVTRDIDPDLVAWSTRAIAPILAAPEVTPERCVDAIRKTLGKFSSDTDVTTRRTKLSNAIGYLPDNMRRERQEARERGELPRRPPPPNEPRITDEEREAAKRAAAEWGPKAAAAIANIGNGGRAAS